MAFLMSQYARAINFASSRQLGAFYEHLTHCVPIIVSTVSKQ